jgi:hypothetical protein
MPKGSVARCITVCKNTIEAPLGIVGYDNGTPPAGLNTIVQKSSVSADHLCTISFASPEIVSSEGLNSFSGLHGITPNDFVILVEISFKKENSTKLLGPMVLVLF